jgi:hypothetical protein
VFGSCSADVGELVMAVVDMLPHSARAKALVQVPGTGQVVFEGVDAAEPAFGHASCPLAGTRCCWCRSCCAWLCSAWAAPGHSRCAMLRLVAINVALACVQPACWQLL